ncbi:MAG: hypothetical protein EOP43_02405 [Sphingobacteriaceae bacterium]|nr:MAG: hypothetical protein EOP43_02405 [Sphingobacteriaceae bacterium]
MKKLLIVLILFTSCKTQKMYIFKPGDTVKVHKNSFLILDYNTTRKGYFYKAQDLKLGFYVEYFSQERLKNVKQFTQLTAQ